MNAWKPVKEYDYGNACKAASISSRVYSDHIDFDKRFESARTDTQAFGWKTDTEIIIAFRGTSSPRDFLIDLKFHKVPFAVPDTSDTAAFTVQDLDRKNLGRVHRGFLMAVGSVWEEIRNWIKGVYYGQPIFITGHSLGGANAVILALRLQMEGFSVSAVYTFGCPKVGDRVFSRIFNEKVAHYRHVNNNDIVTRNPPFATHTGHEYYFNRKGVLVIIGWLRKRWDKLIGRIEQLIFRRSFTDGIDDHSMADYVNRLNQNSSSF